MAGSREEREERKGREVGGEQGGRGAGGRGDGPEGDGWGRWTDDGRTMGGRWADDDGRRMARRPGAMARGGMGWGRSRVSPGRSPGPRRWARGEAPGWERSGRGPSGRRGWPVSPGQMPDRANGAAPFQPGVM